ncbi:MAG: ferritin family protein [Elusimicrobiota bacterium]
MSDFFKPSEIIALAVELEKTGEAFYRAMSLKVNDPAAKKLLQSLSEDEVKHKETFSQMLRSAGEYKPAENFDGEYYYYLKSYSDEHVFNRQAADKYMNSQSITVDTVLSLSISAEKDSILYYTDLANFVPVQERGVVEKIIAQEREHFRKLVELRKTAVKK